MGNVSIGAMILHVLLGLVWMILRMWSTATTVTVAAMSLGHGVRMDPQHVPAVYCSDTAAAALLSTTM